MTSSDLLLRPLRDIPPIATGDDLADIALAGLGRSDDRLRDGDVLIFAQKIVSVLAVGRQDVVDRHGGVER